MSQPVQNYKFCSQKILFKARVCLEICNLLLLILFVFVSATSSKDDLHRRIGGRCTTNNMKVVFKVCCRPDEIQNNQSKCHSKSEGLFSTYTSCDVPRVSGAHGSNTLQRNALPLGITMGVLKTPKKYKKIKVRIFMGYQRNLQRDRYSTVEMSTGTDNLIKQSRKSQLFQYSS